MRKTLLILTALLLFYSCTGTEPSGNGSGTVVLSPVYYTDLFGWNDDGGLTETFLGRGINMGNYLEGPASATYPLGEGSWTGGKLLQQSDFTRIKAQGFKTVRIPVRWSDHAASSSPYTIDAAFIARVKEVVALALNEDLRVVINVHHYEEMMNDGESAQAGHIARLVGIWDQICTEFTLADYPTDKVVFELLNEPNGTIDYNDWNTIIGQLTTCIWTTHAAQQNTGANQRKIMVGTANWGSPEGLSQLNLPTECNSTNTIMTIHYYKPFHFTHQGAEWSEGSEAWIGTPWLGTQQDQEPLIELFNRTTTWNSAAGRGFEIFMGEFGVYSKYSDPSHQKAWTAFIAREAEKRNISWAYWEYDQGFGAYDSSANSWRPQLITGLIPQF